MEQLKKQLVEFFIEMQEQVQFFKRKSYEDAFEKCYANHRELLAAIVEVCEKAEDKDAVIDELASVIPEYAHAQVSAQGKKRKMDELSMDYNMAMVTFVNPTLTYGHSEYCEKLVDAMIEKWNDGPITMKLGKSSYEDLKGSFKSRLCYITTAVCQSQNKGDDCYELNLLRDYRDTYLLASESGSRLVERYYDIAPTIVNRINSQEQSERIYAGIYEHYLSSCIEMIEDGKNAECQKVYTDMVLDLQKEYLHLH